MTRIAFFLHNVVIHPICGVLWLIGANVAADAIHDFWSGEQA